MGRIFRNIQAQSVTYDAREHSIFIDGELPLGVAVTYEGNGRKAVGNYTVTASFKGDANNYNAITSKEAILTILQVSHDLSGIGFENVTVKYDGNMRFVVIDGELPTNVTVTYEGNGRSDANIYTVTAVFSDPDGEFARKTATLTILRTHAETELQDEARSAQVALDSKNGFDPTFFMNGTQGIILLVICVAVAVITIVDVALAILAAVAVSRRKRERRARNFKTRSRV